MGAIRYEWDETERVENRRKHRVDFEAILRFDWSMSIARPDRRVGYGEERILAFAPIDGRLHAAVYTIRGDARRISPRKANRREQAEYAAAVLARLAGG